MNEIGAISATGIESGSPLINQLGYVDLSAAQQPQGASFQSILANGLNATNEKITTANDLVRQFAVDDSIPVHQVTIALEEARLSVEMAMQVRARLVETYRELMTMQL